MTQWKTSPRTFIEGWRRRSKQGKPIRSRGSWFKGGLGGQGVTPVSRWTWGVRVQGSMSGSESWEDIQSCRITVFRKELGKGVEVRMSFCEHMLKVCSVIKVRMSLRYCDHSWVVGKSLCFLAKVDDISSLFDSVLLMRDVLYWGKACVENAAVLM